MPGQYLLHVLLFIETSANSTHSVYFSDIQSDLKSRNQDKLVLISKSWKSDPRICYKADSQGYDDYASQHSLEHNS